MKEVNRACFQCLYDTEVEVYVQPDRPGVGRVFGGSGQVTVLEQSDDPCDLCEADSSLKRE